MKKPSPKNITNSDSVEKESFNKLADVSPVGIFKTDSDGLCIFVNKKWMEIAGLTLEESLGEGWSNAIYIEDRQKVFKEWSRCAQKNIDFKLEYRFQRPNGEITWVIGNATALKESKDIVGHVGTITDITERKQAEEELKGLNKNLEKRVQQEIAKRMHHERILVQQSKMAALGEMLSAIAHQWRQPLNSVGLNVQDTLEAYEDDELDKEYLKKFVDGTMRQIQYMSTTIDNFRTFFKPTKTKTKFSLNKTLYETLNILSAQMKHSFINVAFKEPAEDCFVNGYPDELKQVLLNLFSNSKDAILEKRDKKLTGQDDGKVTISVSFALEKVLIEIHDNGIGIPEDILEDIFNPYYTTKEQGKGTGIGLYMSKMIIEEHMQGRLFCEATKEGATFFIELSREESPDSF